MSRYLDDDDGFLLVNKQLARALGLNAAIVFSRLNFWMRYNERMETTGQRRGKPDHLIDGFWWAYNSYANWQRYEFPFFDVDTIERTFQRLEELGLIITTSRFNDLPADKTKWYTIFYPAYDRFIAIWLQQDQPRAAQRSEPYQTFITLWQQADIFSAARSYQDDYSAPVKPITPSPQTAASTLSLPPTQGQSAASITSESSEEPISLATPSGAAQAAPDELLFDEDDLRRTRAARDAERNYQQELEDKAILKIEDGIRALPRPLAMKNPYKYGSLEWRVYSRVYERELIASGKGQTPDPERVDLQANAKAAAAFLVRLMHSLGTTGVNLDTYLEKKETRLIFFSPIVYTDEQAKPVKPGNIAEVFVADPDFSVWIDEYVRFKSVPILNAGQRVRARVVLDWIKNGYPTYLAWKARLYQKKAEGDVVTDEEPDLSMYAEDDDGKTA